MAKSHDATQWFFAVNGHPCGPVSLEHLQSLVRMNHLLPESMVWNEASRERVRADSLPFLFAKPAEPPPPAAPPQVAPEPIATPAAPQSVPTTVEVPAGAPTRRRYLRWTVAVLTSIVLGVLLNRMWGGRPSLRITPVTGKLSYQDGSVVPAAELRLKFHSLSRPPRASSKPPVGQAVVSGATGEFVKATTLVDGDGLIAGLHRVTIHARDDGHLPVEIVSDQYQSSRTTPLIIDTRTSPLVIKIARPK